VEDLNEVVSTARHLSESIAQPKSQHAEMHNLKLGTQRITCEAEMIDADLTTEENEFL
jgi:hypothetical protein